MTLIINSGSSYETQYDGSCIDALIITDEEDCATVTDAVWSGTECEYPTAESCEGFAIGAIQIPGHSPS